MMLECKECGEIVEVKGDVTVTQETQETVAFVIKGVAPRCPICHKWSWHFEGEDEGDDDGPAL